MRKKDDIVAVDGIDSMKRQKMLRLIVLKRELLLSNCTHMGPLWLMIVTASPGFE